MHPPETAYLDDPAVGPARETSHPTFVAAVPASFWDSTVAGPFDSDDGNDVYATIDEFVRGGGGVDEILQVTESIIASWALVPPEVWQMMSDEIQAWLTRTEAGDRLLHGEIDAYVAGAHAQFKIAGWLDPELRALAERALLLHEWVLAPWEREHLGSDGDDLATTIQTTRAVLAAAPSSPATT